MSIELSSFPVVVTFPMHWGEQDAMGHVNNIIYFRWAETARMEYFWRLGIRPGQNTADQGPILAAISCDFRIPLTHPDTIHVSAQVTSIGNSSFKMAHRIVSGQRSAVAAELTSTMVWFDYRNGRSAPLPAEIRAAIESLEARGQLQ